MSDSVAPTQRWYARFGDVRWWARYQGPGGEFTDTNKKWSDATVTWSDATITWNGATV